MKNHDISLARTEHTIVADEGLYYTIQEVSERLGIPIQKLRRWDQDGVLTAQRSFGGHRRYLRELIDRLAAQSISPDKTSKQLATIKKSLAEKQRIIQLLLDSEHRYRDLVETSHDLVWTTDPQGRFTYLNNAARDIFGLAPRDLSGRCFFDFEAGNAHIANRRFLALLRRNGEIRDYVTHVVTARGDSRWIGINARTLLDDNREIMGIRGTARDITEQHLATRRIEHLAMHDTLTDLPNRVALQARIEGSIADGTPGALLLHMHQNDQIGRKLRYFVNLSRVSISDPHWVKRFINMLSLSKVDPGQLVFEITETAAMSEIDVTLNFIRRVKDMGSRFALDDFGAGFSSFYYLKRFEVDYLKIDGGFIRDLASDGSNQVFVKALNDVAKGMGKQVIAEWVETPEVLQILQDIGAQYGQGYLFSPPRMLDSTLESDAVGGFNAA